MNKSLLAISLVLIVTLVGCDSMPGIAGGSTAMSLPGTTGVAASAASGTAQSSDLVGLLVNKLGVTPQQATGGAGSIFSLTKQRLNPTDFGQIRSAVPGVDSMIAAVPPTSTMASGSGLGSAATGLGGLGAMAGLAGSFQSLGMNSGMVNQFVPVVLDYVGGKGGTGTLGLMKGALGL